MRPCRLVGAREQPQQLQVSEAFANQCKRYWLDDHQPHRWSLTANNHKFMKLTAEEALHFIFLVNAKKSIIRVAHLRICCWALVDDQ